jgi:hypothetical protein
MIFNNEAALAEAAVDATPIIEGYDSLLGGALALVENAQNEYKMFEAMLQVDYTELAMRESATDEAVLESNLEVMAEAAKKGIMGRIAAWFRNIAAKVKTIFMTFKSKFLAFIGKDKAYITKICKAAEKNAGDAGSLKVKWIDNDNYTAEGLKQIETYNTIEDIKNATIDFKAEAKAFKSKYVTSAKEMSIDKIGASKVIDLVKNFNKTFGALDKYSNSVIKNMNKLAAEAEKMGVKNANDAELYKKVTAYTSMIISQCNTVIAAAKDQYKYAKSAVIKLAGGAKNESAMYYAECVCEAAEQEVDDAIEAQLPKEDISDVSTATKDVLDPGVSDTADVSALHASDNTDDYKPTKPEVTPREESAIDDDIVADLF